MDNEILIVLSVFTPIIAGLQGFIMGMLYSERQALRRKTA